MKYSIVAASLCVLGSASAFVVPVSVRTAGATRVSASETKEAKGENKEKTPVFSMEDKQQAREDFVASDDVMETIMDVVGKRDTDEFPAHIDLMAKGKDKSPPAKKSKKKEEDSN